MEPNSSPTGNPSKSPSGADISSGEGATDSTCSSEVMDLGLLEAEKPSPHLPQPCSEVTQKGLIDFASTLFFVYKKLIEFNKYNHRYYI